MPYVIDTNVLLAIIPTKSSYHYVYQALLDNEIEIAVSTEILFEYEEQLKVRYASTLSVDEEIDKFLKNKNIRFYQPNYKWNFITADPDDNKFVDCAIAANADYIITNDAHFNILKNIAFPRVNTLTLQQFIQLITAK
jgi:putative PIN family toxin of toxin-antitoxin system